MSAPSPDDKPQSSAGTFPTHRNLVIPILAACLVVLAGLYSPWILYISFAMLPCILIRMIDKSEKRVLSFSVTGLNLTGLMLALQHSFGIYGLSPAPGVLFKDWVNWLFPFGLAWLGILFFMAFPVVFAALIEIRLSHKERRLKEQQKALLQTWGTQLTQNTATPSGGDDEKDENDEEKNTTA